MQSTWLGYCFLPCNHVLNSNSLSRLQCFYRCSITNWKWLYPQGSSLRGQFVHITCWIISTTYLKREHTTSDYLNSSLLTFRTAKLFIRSLCPMHIGCLAKSLFSTPGCQCNIPSSVSHSVAVLLPILMGEFRLEFLWQSQSLERHHRLSAQMGKLLSECELEVLKRPAHLEVTCSRQMKTEVISRSIRSWYCFGWCVCFVEVRHVFYPSAMGSSIIP